MGSLPEEEPLTISIVGGGISGLSAAIALRRAGHLVTVYERSDGKNELGAAIHVSPNASRILLRWNVDPERADFVVAKKSLISHGTNLKAIGEINYGSLIKDYGAAWFYAHRVDLHDELKKVATDDSHNAVGIPIRFNTRAKVVAIDAGNASITLESGDIVKSDLVVGADGVHSDAAKVVLGADKPAVFTGQAAYRFLIPSEELAKDEQTSVFLDDGTFKVYLGSTGNRIVWYPCRGNTVQNFVGLIHEKQNLDQEDWNHSAKLESLLHDYGDLHPSLRAVLNKATGIKKWPLFYREPVFKWFEGMLVLVGDAVHPMLPHQGQAGAQAIEDGEALGILLQGLTKASIEHDSKLLKRRLQAFQDLRSRRVASIQIFSNAGQDQAERNAQLARPYVEGPIPSNPVEFNIYNFSYDVAQHSRAAVEQLPKI